MSRWNKRSLLSDFAFLGLARAAVVGMNLLVTSRMAHALGAENFGINAFAMSLVSYFNMVVNLGYDALLTRETAHDRSRMRDLVAGAIVMRLLLALGMLALLLITLTTLRVGGLTKLVVLIYSLNLVSSAIGVTSVYQGLQNMRVVALRETAAALFNLVAILIFVHGPEDFVPAAVIMASSGLIMNGLILFRYIREFGGGILTRVSRTHLKVMRETLPYFWSMMMITITYNVHIVLLGLFRTDAEVGLFSAAWKLFVFATVLPSLLSTLFMPRIARDTASVEARRASSLLYMQSIVLFAVPVTMIGQVLAHPALRFLFGGDYTAAAPTLVLLLLNALIVSFNTGFATPLTAVGRQSTFLKIVAVGALIGIALNLALIPHFGVLGAAVATVIDEIFILALFMWRSPEVPVRQTLAFTLRCVGAAIPAVLLTFRLEAWLSSSEPDLVVILAAGSAGALAYLALLHVTGVPLLPFAKQLHRAA